MRSLRLGFIWFCLTGFVAVPLYGQSRYSLTQLSDENGLPQNSIKGLAIGDAGFLWIATEAGLVRFDGQRTRVYSKDVLQTRSDRLSRFDRNPFDGSLTALVEHGELLRVHNGQASFDRTYKVETERFFRLKLSPDPRVVFMPVSSNNYYVYVAGKVALIRNGRVIFQMPFKGTPFFQKFPSEFNMRNRVIRETKDSVCADNFFTLGGKLYYHLSSEGPSFWQISAEGRVLLSIDGPIRRDSLYGRQKATIRLWQNRAHGQVFACLGRNIYQVLPTGRNNGLTTRLLASGFSIEERLVSEILYDEASRTLFLGSFSKGLFILRRQFFRPVIATEEKDFHNVFYAQVPLHTPGVAIAEGLAAMENPAGKVVFSRLWTATKAGRFNMVRDRSGMFWLRDGQEILRMNAETGKKETIATFPEEPPSLYQGFEDGIWLGFRSGKTVYLSPGAGKKPDSLFTTRAQINFQYQDIPGRHWIGTNEGLYVASLTHRKLAFVGLKGKIIRSLYASAPGELWIMTYGDGMYLFKRGYLRRIQPDRNGYLKYAHCIAEDSHGNFWISSNKGLFRAHKADLLAYAEGKTSSIFYVYYNRDNGLITNEFNGGCQPCMARLPDGRFSFPTINGLVWFHPDSIPMPELRSTFIVDEIRVDGEAIVSSDTLTIGPDFQYVNVQLTSPLFHNQENLVFYYRIDKAGDSPTTRWKQTEADQSFRLYGLSPGDYVLTIRKTAGFLGKHIDKKIFLHIPAPWYMQVWFWLLAALVALLLIRAYTHWRLLVLKRQNEALRERVEERTLHLSQALEDVRKSEAALQKQLQIQLRIISALNHDLLTPLRFLNKSIPLFVDKVAAELPDSPTTQIGRSLRLSTRKVVDFADNLLKFTKATYLQNEQLISDRVNVSAILRAKASFFEEIARENGTKIVVRKAGPVIVPSREQMLEIVVHNLVDNALKHTYRSTITLGATEEADGSVLISVADSGDGMPVEIVDWLNYGPTETGSGNAAPRVPVNIGLGLIIVREITDLLGIRLSVRSGSGGTVFTLRITGPQ